MDAAVIWGAAGLILVIADVAFGSFFMLFLGAGALITAMLAWGSVLPAPIGQWLCFAAASAAGVVFLRKPILRRFGSKSENRYEEHAGQRVLVCEAIPAGGTGRVMYRGAEWPARTWDGNAMDAEMHAQIVSLDGIMLVVRPESPA